ncbi:MAG: hypothetical protein V3W34_09715 [Phycisphaerae bacterium]
MKPVYLTAVILAAGMSASAMAGENGIAPSTPDPQRKVNDVYEFEVESIDGQPVKLSKYQGLVLMIVNVASR